MMTSLTENAIVLASIAKGFDFHGICSLDEQL